MINLPTKFEVFSFIRYGDMKGAENAQNGVVWGWLGVTQGHRQSPFDRAHRSSYSSLIETMRLYCTVFETQRVICLLYTSDAADE